MSEETVYDVVTIGAGSGGTRASRMVAKIPGKKVAVVELPFGLVSSKEVGGAGGTCVIRGCVPKKLLVYASSFQADFRDAGGYGWENDVSPGYALKKMMEKKAAEVERLNGIYGRLLKNSGCDYIEGYGKILDPNTVEVTAADGTKRQLKTKNILVATGGRAFVPEIPGKELCDTSDEALVYDTVPETMVIVGGGYIAVEFAGIYAGFGSKVHLICRRELPLRGFDKECRELVLKNLEARGIVFHANTNPASIEKTDAGKLAVTIKTSDGGTQVIQSDKCMFATGRKPNVENLGLENVNVELGPNKAIKVNNILQTSVPSIWALGDVIDRIQLTPVALMEGMAFTETMKGHPKEPDYTCVASAVFCQPPLATVGISEEEAIEKHVGEIDVFVEGFRPMKNTISGRDERSLMKLVVDTATGKVLGAHMVGPDAAEIMQGIAVALKCGATKAQFDSTIGIHPSSAEEFVTMRTMTRRVKCKGIASSQSKI